MADSNQEQIDRDLATSMDMFRRVQVGEVGAIEPRRPQRVLLALDGSSQDGTSTAIAAGLVERYDCAVVLLAACAESEAVVGRAAGYFVDGTATMAVGPDDPFEPILSAVEKEKSDLVIAPCPFGREFEKIGPDSAGTIIDVLLARLHVPLLAVREPHEIARPMFRCVALQVPGENNAALDAAAWAAAMVAADGHLKLSLVVAEELREDLIELLQAMRVDVELTTDDLAAALQREYVRLHRGLQKTSAKLGFQYDMSVIKRQDEEADAGRSLDDVSLMVVALERGSDMSQGYTRYCVLHSRAPVLVVPSN